MLAATLALSSSFLASITMILMKKAIERTNPTSAMLVVTLFGSIIYLVISFSIKTQDLPIFLAVGIFLTASWLSLFYALSHGKAIIVTPLSNLHPLFILVLSHFFLGKVDKITRGV